MRTPGLLRRLGSVVYDGLAVIALWLLASAIVTSLFGDAGKGQTRLILQCSSVAVVSAYFLWCWSHGGQTLAMKTWHIRVVDENGNALTMVAALHRYLLACLGFMLAGIGFWWALLDKNRQFLHDRLGHTRLIQVDTAVPSGAPSRPASPSQPPEKATSARSR